MKLKYLENYPDNIKEAVKRLIEKKELGLYLKNKYPDINIYNKDKDLYLLSKKIKDKHMKKQKLPERIIYDNKIELENYALGLHSYIPKKQGKKIKMTNEIKISSRFKKLPFEFMENVLVHELCHLKEKEHNKAFYNLCQSIRPNYFQVDLDIRIYLTYKEIFGSVLWQNKV
jgi:hypothetical protein